MKPQKPTALFVDSDEEHREALREILTEKGYQVRSFNNGSKLIRYIIGEGAKIRPSLILLDVSAQGLGGFEAARRLTQMPGSKEIPIIMMAKYCCAEDKLEAQSAGAITCLQKPVTIAAVEAEISEKKQRQVKNINVIRNQFKMDFS